MKQLIKKKLLWGVVVIVISQILGMLPALDFLPQNYLKGVCFLLGVVLTIAKGIEMFFDQSAQLENTTEMTTKSTSLEGAEILQISKTTTTTPIVPAEKQNP